MVSNAFSVLSFVLVASENVKYRCRKTDDCLSVLLSTFSFNSGQFFFAGVLQISCAIKLVCVNKA